MRRAATVALLAAASCGQPDAASDDDALPVDVWMTRVSLDLRGIRPSLRELRDVHADPTRADALVEAWLKDPRFGSHLADAYAELYLTRTESWSVPLSSTGIEASFPDYVHALGEAPLQVIARVANDDLPWTDLVLADWTMANDVLADLWPLDVEPGDGWRVARWTDGRPSAGLLSGNALWWRYTTTDSNANRGRAAQVSRLFLCVDYREIPVPFEPTLDLLDAEAVAAATRGEPSCASCHDTLDPIAGYLYGFWAIDPTVPAEMVPYHAERESLWRSKSGLPPALGDEPGYTLRDLGRQLAADDRFPDCAVEQAFRIVFRREPRADDAAARVEVRNAFVGGGLTARSLYGAIVRSDAYRSAGEAGAGLRLASPELLASQVEDLTGFRWVTADGWDLMRADLAGLRGLAGGADGVSSSRNATLPGATVVLVQERLAQAAAGYVVAHDAQAAPRDRTLLTAVDPTLSREDAGAAFVDQLVDLHARVFGRVVRADGPEVAAHTELFDALIAVDADPVAAWTGVVTAMLRDPDLLLY